MTTVRRYCVIGAGYAGNGVAKAFKDAGIAYDHIERNDAIGGNWYDGVYDSTHIISSRDTTGYGDFPMPDSYPDFPSRDQMLAYLNSYVHHFGLRDRIEFETEVVSVEPLDERGMTGWRVELDSGEVRYYDGVVVANGHHWRKRIPSYPGRFSGCALHSKEYKRPSDCAGERVLVVGVGNSGCDIAVEAARNFGSATISMRRGNWFLPKTLFGVPVAELDRRWTPTWAQRAFLKAALRVSLGSYERYGLPEPDYELFEKHPIVNSQLLYQLRHGVVTAKPDIERLDGRTVHFADGTSEEFDTIVYATGFDVEFPFLDHDLLEWRDGSPVRAGGFMAPGLANLYLFGLAQPRGGAGPLITAGAELLAEMVRLQEHLERPLGDEFAKLRKPDARMLYGVHELFRFIRRGRFGAKVIARRAKRSGRWIDEPVAVAGRAPVTEPAATYA
jgi:cation diffusion facilitator CzcD-associated flavoprotein CzcO